MSIEAINSEGTSSELTESALDDILAMAIPETSQNHDNSETQIER